MLQIGFSPNADIVLRTSDGWQFGVDQERLRDASPHFMTMFAIAPTGEERPVVDVDLPGDVLWILMRMLYAVEPSYPGTTLAPTPSSMDDILILLSAAEKLELVHLEERIKTELLTPACLAESNPIRAWGVARAYGLGQKFVREAELRYLVSITDLASTWTSIPELDKVFAGDFTKLVKRRQLATLALEDELVAMLWGETECSFCDDPLGPNWDPEEPWMTGRGAFRRVVKDLHPMSPGLGGPLPFLLAAKETTCSECKKACMELGNGAKGDMKTTASSYDWHISVLQNCARWQQGPRWKEVKAV